MTGGYRDVEAVEADVVIAGAGPAGLAAACDLGRLGWRVLVVERAASPRRKLCGEFLSGDGWRVLEDLDLSSDLGRAGCPPICEARVATLLGQQWQVRVPGLGRGCSRELLVEVLTRRCRDLGVQIRYGLRTWRDSDASPVRVEARGRGGRLRIAARLFVSATGHLGAARADARTGRRPGARWAAFALHGRASDGVPGSAVELYALPGGYAGLCPIEGGRVNLCLLLRAPARRPNDADPIAGSTEELRHVTIRNRLLTNRLDHASFDWCEVVYLSGCSFGYRLREGSADVAIGDAACAPVPLLGQGLAAAFRGARIVAAVADRFLGGEIDRTRLQRDCRRAWVEEFGWRFRAGGWLQRALLAPVAAELAVGLLRMAPWAGQRLVRGTRGELAEAG